MKIFWPYRSKVKGFSIDNLADKYRGKVINISSNKKPNQILGDKNLKSTNSNHIETFSLSVKKGHWANRDFSEYKEAA